MRAATLFLVGMSVVLALIAFGFTGPPAGPLANDTAITATVAFATPAPACLGMPTAFDLTHPQVDTVVMTEASMDGRSTIASGYTLANNHPLDKTLGNAAITATPRPYLLL